MSARKNKPGLVIKLTEDQKEQLVRSTDRQAAQRLMPEELEERIAPATNLNSSRSNIY